MFLGQVPVLPQPWLTRRWQHGCSSRCRWLCQSCPGTEQGSRCVQDNSLTAFPRPIMALFHFLHYLPHSLGSRCGVCIAWDKGSVDASPGCRTWLPGQDPLQLPHPLSHPLYNLNSMGLPKRRQITALIASPPARLQRLLWTPPKPIPCLPWMSHAAPVRALQAGNQHPGSNQQQGQSCLSQASPAESH